MKLEQFYQRFHLDRSLVEKVGFNPYYPMIESGLEDPLMINGKPYINLASNNYLGLAADPRVKESIITAVSRYGASLCGTPIATGSIELYQRLERKLADFVGLEDAIILPSGYQTNNGLFSAVAGKEDLMVVDHYAHSSLIEGIRAAGCKIRPFLHNNMGHLEEILQKSASYRQIFIVTESVFSTAGEIAPLREINVLAEKYGAVPVIDDSHGIGVIGDSGRGILAYDNLSNYPGIYTASLGKALACTGGIIAGKKDLIEYLRYYCSHLVYSTALPPAMLAGVEEVLRILSFDFAEISARMWRYKNIVRQALQEAGFPLTSGKAPITSVIAGTPEDTLALAKKLFDLHLLTTPFVAPSVPYKEGKVRFIVGANLKEETVAEAARLIRKLSYKS